MAAVIWGGQRRRAGRDSSSSLARGGRRSRPPYNAGFGGAQRSRSLQAQGISGFGIPAFRIRGGMPRAGLNGLDVEIDRPSDVRRWPGLRIQSEVTQDPSNHFGLAWLDEADHLHPPAAPGAGERIDLEDTLDKPRPASATRGPVGRARVVENDGELAGRLPSVPSTLGSCHRPAGNHALAVQ